jgi:chemotaxis protein histidine kinase CheA
MRKRATLLLAAALLGGCATAKTGDSGGFFQRHSESKKLAQAVELLAKGDSRAAANLLNGISSGSSIPGITDEALFRLALLSLNPGTDRPASAHGSQLLRRLKKEYPSSPWTVQAAPLTELINVAEELKRQNRSLKATNQSLNKEIGSINKTLQQLKHLDLELEQNTR